MKTQAANQIATSLYKSQRIARELESDIVALEKEIQNKMAKLAQAKEDLQAQNSYTTELTLQWEDSIRKIKSEFSSQPRFANSPSEEINRAFSNEVLPNLNEVE
jgi:hypothetical protein